MSVYEITLLLNGEEQSKDIIEHNGKQYRKAKRKAVVGELVVVVAKNNHYYGYENGDIYEVTNNHFGKRKGVHLSGEFDDGTELYVYHEEYETLEPIEQSGQLTERDLIANLAQEVAELKRELSEYKATVAHRGRTLEINVGELKDDIADLEDRLDENEKDTEEVEQNLSEVIGRMNDLGDGAEATAVVPTMKFDSLIVALETLGKEADRKHKYYDDNDCPANSNYNEGKAYGYFDAISKIKEVLRNG